MHVCSIVGARPQFVKLAVICTAVEARAGWTHTIVHTGQHYDPGLSSVFFEELQIPRPDYDLEVGSGSHGEQIGERDALRLHTDRRGRFLRAQAQIFASRCGFLRARLDRRAGGGR